jgi:hypothetical protein
MTHGPEHQIEHAEHAAHAAHDPFDKRVTVSIAVVAAILAAITMLGHKAHNETLRYQTEASIEHSQSFNRWAAYQAQNIRKHMYDGLALHLAVGTQGKTSPEVEKVIKDWRDKSDDYENVKLPKWRKEAEGFEAKGKEAQEKSHLAHARGERFDLGELGLQLGVVLCSLAILSKQRGFWYAGLGCSLLGLLVALTGVFGLFMGGHH